MLIPSDCFHGTEVPEIMRDLTPEEVVGLNRNPRWHTQTTIPRSASAQAGLRRFETHTVPTPWVSSLCFWLGVSGWTITGEEVLSVRADACVRFSKLKWPEAWELAEQRAEKL